MEKKELQRKIVATVLTMAGLCLVLVVSIVLLLTTNVFSTLLKWLMIGCCVLLAVAIVAFFRNKLSEIRSLRTCVRDREVPSGNMGMPSADDEMDDAFATFETDSAYDDDLFDGAEASQEDYAAIDGGAEYSYDGADGADDSGFVLDPEAFEQPAPSLDDSDHAATEVFAPVSALQEDDDPIATALNEMEFDTPANSAPVRTYAPHQAAQPQRNVAPQPGRAAGGQSTGQTPQAQNLGYGERQVSQPQPAAYAQQASSQQNTAQAQAAVYGQQVRQTAARQTMPQQGAPQSMVRTPQSASPQSEDYAMPRAPQPLAAAYGQQASVRQSGYVPAQQNAGYRQQSASPVQTAAQAQQNAAYAQQSQPAAYVQQNAGYQQPRAAQAQAAAHAQQNAGSTQQNAASAHPNNFSVQNANAFSQRGAQPSEQAIHPARFGADTGSDSTQKAVSSPYTAAQQSFAAPRQQEEDNTPRVKLNVSPIVWPDAGLPPPLTAAQRAALAAKAARGEAENDPVSTVAAAAPAIYTADARLAAQEAARADAAQRMRHEFEEQARAAAAQKTADSAEAAARRAAEAAERAAARLREAAGLPPLPTDAALLGHDSISSETGKGDTFAPSAPASFAAQPAAVAASAPLRQPEAVTASAQPAPLSSAAAEVQTHSFYERYSDATPAPVPQQPSSWLKEQ